MNKKLVSLVMLVSLLALSLVFVSCDNGTTTKGDPTDSIVDGLGLDRAKIREIGLNTSGLTGAQSGNYIVIWGAFWADMTDVDSAILEEGWSGSVTSVSDGRYATGTTAVDILNYCVNYVAFEDGGGSIDTYENLMNYQSGGVGLPVNLKNALSSKSAEVPITGVFQSGDSLISAFFVDQID
jgi:hypothetical protein